MGLGSFDGQQKARSQALGASRCARLALAGARRSGSGVGPTPNRNAVPATHLNSRQGGPD